jgi:hypothetical protein
MNLLRPRICIYAFPFPVLFCSFSSAILASVVSVHGQIVAYTMRRL